MHGCACGECSLCKARIRAHRSYRLRGRPRPKRATKAANSGQFSSTRQPDPITRYVGPLFMTPEEFAELETAAEIEAEGSEFRMMVSAGATDDQLAALFGEDVLTDRAAEIARLRVRREVLAQAQTEAVQREVVAREKAKAAVQRAFQQAKQG